jgi:hypothetical protein
MSAIRSPELPASISVSAGRPRPWKRRELDLSSAHDPLGAASQLIRYTGSRARRWLFYSRLGQVGIIGSSASIPVSIILSTRWFDFFLGKVAPSVLAALAAAAIRFVQIERPHDHWKLYWRAQKAVEDEVLLYVNRATPYTGADREGRLIARIHEIHSSLCDDCINLTPRTADVLKTARTEHPR